jgi:hypothetical protein
MPSGPSGPGSPRPSVRCRATHGPSSEGPRDPWRWSRPRSVGRDPVAGGRSAAEFTPLSSSRTLRAVRRRDTVRRSDDNSRCKVQNVPGDSSGVSTASASHRGNISVLVSRTGKPGAAAGAGGPLPPASWVSHRTILPTIDFLDEALDRLTAEIDRGASSQETIASILRDEPDFGKVPAQAHRLLKRRLEKAPQNRLRHIGDVMSLLDEAPAGPQSGAVAPSLAPVKRNWLWPGVGVVIVGAVLAVSALRRSQTGTADALRFGVGPAAKMPFINGGAMAGSPDGHRIYGDPSTSPASPAFTLHTVAPAVAKWEVRGDLYEARFRMS